MKKQRRFKPYYKWNTFNTMAMKDLRDCMISVLNLIINGIPSILIIKNQVNFKNQVLNLIINGIPSILIIKNQVNFKNQVLNLIINGIPSILARIMNMATEFIGHRSFKPYYKWNTFNTEW